VQAVHTSKPGETVDSQTYKVSWEEFESHSLQVYWETKEENNTNRQEIEGQEKPKEADSEKTQQQQQGAAAPEVQKKKSVRMDVAEKPKDEESSEGDMEEESTEMDQRHEEKKRAREERRSRRKQIKAKIEEVAPELLSSDFRENDLCADALGAVFVETPHANQGANKRDKPPQKSLPGLPPTSGRDSSESESERTTYFFGRPPLSIKPPERPYSATAAAATTKVKGATAAIIASRTIAAPARPYSAPQQRAAMPAEGSSTSTGPVAAPVAVTALVSQK